VTTNVIDLFARGNQELFHSAFIGWLLDEHGSHGLGSQFLGEFTASLPAQIAGRLTVPLRVRTEYPSGGSRFDVLLEPLSPSLETAPFKGLVLENKIKSFGNAVQLDKYSAQGFDVLVLALIPETLDDAAKRRYPVVTYSLIHDLLQRLPLDPTNPYHFLIREYRTFLAHTLSTYELIARYCNSDISQTEFMAGVRTALSGSILRDNDIRTYSYYYYYLLAEYIQCSAPDLAFGTRTYVDAERDNENTQWQFEKNMQGAPFMEAIIYRPCDTPPWKLQTALASIETSKPIQIAPRIEVWLDLNRIVAAADGPDPVVGSIMLGTWAPELKQALRTLKPYASTLTPRPRADRNFHYESLALSDIAFEKIIARIRRALRLIFDYATNKRLERTVGA
jgi:hypothetical protein